MAGCRQQNKDLLLFLFFEKWVPDRVPTWVPDRVPTWVPDRVPIRGPEGARKEKK